MDERGAVLRVSDSEREAAVSALRDHFFAGRLSSEEFIARVEEAYSARTRAELETVERELPIVEERSPGRRKPWLFPGNERFAVRVHTRKDPERAVDEALAAVLPRLAGTGYLTDVHEPARRTFVREERPGWTIAVAALFFPFGLVALAHRSRSSVVVHASQADERITAVDIYGTAPLAVRRVIRDWAAG